MGLKNPGYVQKNNIIKGGGDDDSDNDSDIPSKNVDITVIFIAIVIFITAFGLVCIIAKKKKQGSTFQFSKS